MSRDEPGREPEGEPIRGKRVRTRLPGRPLRVLALIWSLALLLMSYGLYHRFRAMGFDPLYALLLVGILALLGLLAFALLNRTRQ